MKRFHRSMLFVAGMMTAAAPAQAQRVASDPGPERAYLDAEMRALTRDSGTAMVWISHDLATVSSVADRLLVMQRGRIIEQGLTDQVLDDPQHPYTQLLVSSVLTP